MKQWTGMSISNKEGPKFRLHNELVAPVFIIVANTKKALNIDAIAATFTPLWR